MKWRHWLSVCKREVKLQEGHQGGHETATNFIIHSLHWGNINTNLFEFQFVFFWQLVRVEWDQPKAAPSIFEVIYQLKQHSRKRGGEKRANCLKRTHSCHWMYVCSVFNVVTCWWGLRDQFSLIAGSQKSSTSLSMVVMRVDPNFLVSVIICFPCLSVMYSPAPVLKL